jgi:hypothetical protein
MGLGVKIQSLLEIQIDGRIYVYCDFERNQKEFERILKELIQPSGKQRK